MSRVWQNLNLGLISIATTLTFWSVVGSQVTSCINTSEFNNFCTVALNSWGITESGYNDLKSSVPEGALLIDVVKVCTISHMIISLIGWLLYAVELKISGALVTALGHIAGWVVLGVVVTETPAIASVVDALSSEDYSTTDFTFGNAIIASITATVLQLCTVASTFLQIFVYEGDFLDDFFRFNI